MKLKNSAGIVRTNRNELLLILLILKEFYSKLYRSRQERQGEPKEIKITSGVINQGSKDMFHITIEEIQNKYKNKMKNNKATGEDEVAIGGIKLGGDNYGGQKILGVNFC
jgi:hypothetical protein